MLIRFNIGNFLSFNEEQEFSMIAGKVRKHNERIYEGQNIKLIKFASIFGANASGKTNLVKAFSFARELIFNKFPDEFRNSYCKVNKENTNKISYFDFEIEIDNKYYSYGFEIILNTKEIKSEWLYEISKKKEKVIFERQVDKGEYIVDKYFTTHDVNKKLDIYANDVKTKNSVLFLTVLNSDKDSLYIDHPQTKIFKQIYNWFKTSLEITYPSQIATDIFYFLSSDNLETFSNYLKAFNTGISAITRNEVTLKQIKLELESKQINKAMDLLNDDINSERGLFLRVGTKSCYYFEKENDEIKFYMIEFYHSNTDLKFDLFEESEGTIRIIDLIFILMNEEGNKTYIIDELDRSLHPNLTKEFVSEFLKFAKKRNNQLIVTTNESRLLTLDLLRKDEIWFTDKDNKGESKIYSLDEFNERFDKKIDSAYLEGRYGAVPIIYNLE